MRWGQRSNLGAHTDLQRRAGGASTNAMYTLLVLAHAAVEPVNTCEMNVGRLLEIRVAASYRNVRDVDEMIGMIGAQFQRLPSDGKVVIAADWTSVSVMAPDTAARARQMLANTNSRVVRSSILVRPGHATANLQVLRLVREADNDHRRHFTSARMQFDWLAEVLHEDEKERLRVFLGLMRG
jgi:hypothetical protein